MHSDRTPKQLILIAAAVLLLAVIIWYAFVPSSKPDESSKHPDSTSVSTVNSNPGEVVFPVEVAIAHRGDLVKRLSTTGIIRANREVEIVARTAGEIVFVGAQNGEYVKQGDVLVKLDDREYRLAFDRASAGLLSAQIEYRSLSTSPYVETADSAALIQKKLKVREKLRDAELRHKEGAISQEQFARMRRDYETELAVYDAQRSDVVATKSGLSQARESYERAKLDLESTQIRAPFPGYVADCDLAPGMRIPMEKVVMKLVDVSTLYVDVEVLESEIGKLRVGRGAEASVSAYPGQAFTGRVSAINPIVDPKSKTVKVTIKLAPDRSVSRFTSNISPSRSAVSRLSSSVLRPGMFCTVRVETGILKSLLLLPKSALLVRDQRTLVFIAQSGLAKWRYVDVGEENERFIEVQSGVSPGDTVIVGGHYTLAHEAKIAIQR